MTREAINELKKYTLGKKNTEKVEISVLQLNRVIKALEQELCEDAISKKRALAPYKDLNDDDVISVRLIKKNITELPPITQKSDEQAYNKGFEDCKQAVLDKMKERDEELSSICPRDIKELLPVTPQ